MRHIIITVIIVLTEKDEANGGGRLSLTSDLIGYGKTAAVPRGLTHRLLLKYYSTPVATVVIDYARHPMPQLLSSSNLDIILTSAPHCCVNKADLCFDTRPSPRV